MTVKVFSLTVYPLQRIKSHNAFFSKVKTGLRSILTKKVAQDRFSVTQIDQGIPHQSNTGR